MFEKSNNCLYSIIDDVGRYIKATDKNIVENFYKSITNTQLFDPGKKSSLTKFGIHHFAGDVIYDAENFLEKNKDSSDEDFGEILRQSSHSLL